ncbi:Anaphase-promoting complex subunit 23 [Pleurotus ostreatus]|uniref:Cdc23 domain-containing protein n=2 Tax=Pleurotus ostreatus TaxID=5322 RepID=A0A067NWV1_PLEO1|nr:Anaphase-promoting complex subunit 23 [Pleurotus ostreatus]KAF7428632.1 Anaphase-promoting complex subunit 23 [Pleurotus ostreatus]KDQ28106.1 hypothetical protein PLEOSDRAFT_29419 [Pleurotus ostreatus PC15]
MAGFVVDHQTISELRLATKECAERGLLVASKWASELLLSIPHHKRTTAAMASMTFSTSTPARPRSPLPTLGFEYSPIPAPATAHLVADPDKPSETLYLPQSKEEIILQVQLEAQEQDAITSSRTLMDQREFMRAVHLLEECKSPKARFIRIYCKFIASEKDSLRSWHKLDNNRNQPPIPVNKTINSLFEEVQRDSDPWLLFLKALFLSQLSRRQAAIESALLSIAGFPWNWSAWVLLSNCVRDGDELTGLLPLMPLPSNHALVHMFQIKTMNELNNPSEHELGLCDALLTEDLFPNSLWIMSLRANCLYNLHDFGQAEAQFDQIHSMDPHRIDNIDIFSNILYVTDNRLKLSKLAHEFLRLEKDRPEVCCLVGNHYSLRAEHEKAVKYFRRATQLDRTFLSAWTLMGHEYVEMKNSHAAIEAYRRAVDVNRKDYRAWYGLGQAYELLSMHQYALHYYQHATALRPYDVRLWQAQGMCYEEIGRFGEAIECLRRALLGADPNEIIITLKLARLHSLLGQRIESIGYHRRVVSICQATQRPVADYAKSCLEVAEFEVNTLGGNLMLAKECAETVAGSNAEEVGRASDLLKGIKMRLRDLELAETEARERAYGNLPHLAEAEARARAQYLAQVNGGHTPTE